MKYYVIYKMDIRNNSCYGQTIIGIVEKEEIAHHFCYVEHQYGGYSYETIEVEEK